MVKLIGLIDGMAEALNVEPSRVRTAAAALRVEKLITTGPRGPGAPEMTAADATNLLLALMYSDDLSASAKTVARLREASVCSSGQMNASGLGLATSELPPCDKFKQDNGEPAKLGPALDGLLEQYVQEGRVGEFLELTARSPAYIFDVDLHAEGKHWGVTYQWRSPLHEELVSTPKADWSDPRFHEITRPRMSTARTVEPRSLGMIADCLRGGRLEAS